MQAITKQQARYSQIVDLCLLNLALVGNKKDCQVFKKLASKCQQVNYLPKPNSWQGSFSREGLEVLKTTFKSLGLLNGREV